MKEDIDVATDNELNKSAQATEEKHPDAHWYALQVYSGHENKARNLLEKRIAENANPNVLVHQVLVPTQEVMEIKQGKKTRVTKNLYPGYILVEGLMNDET